MRATRSFTLRPSLQALLASFCAAALLAACSSSDSTGPGTTTPDTGVDSSIKDGPGDDSDTSSPKDTGSPDTKETGGGKTCDPHPGDECDMVKQNCPTATDTCDYSQAVGHNTCVTIPPGTAGKGEACDPKNPCDKGLFCYSGHCSPACCVGDNSVCGAGGECKLSITAPGDGGDSVIYHACTYSNVCHPFKYDCSAGEICNFDSDPDVFKCSSPSPAGSLSAKPGGVCKYTNDCGESQACFALKADAAPTDYKCQLFCWATKPDAFSVGTKPDGRFPADGTCTVGGVSYGTCTAIGGIGGGLGICIK